MPILKPKEAEFTALAQIDCTGIYPLIDLIGARQAKSGWKSKRGKKDRKARAAQLPTDHLDEVYALIAQNWGDNPILLDPHLFLYQHPTSDEALLEALESWSHPTDDIPVRVIPVLRLDTSTGLALSLGELAQKQGKGLAIRVTKEQIKQPRLASDINAIPKLARIPTRQTDLIIDLGQLVGENIVELIQDTVKAINGLNIADFRSLTVAGTSFNGNPKEEEKQISRLELTVWRNIDDQVNIEVNFGDYGVDAPAKLVSPGLVDDSINNSVAAIRYTYSNYWLFLKEASKQSIDAEGETVTQRGSFRKVCQRLINSQEFIDPDFSPGDRYFQDMADGKFDKEGNPTAWRKAAFSHHYVFIQRQLEEDDDPGAIDADDELPI